MTDPVHFMKKYCKIEHPMKGKINFNLYPFQERTLSEFLDNRFNIILKSRQMGISTLTAGYSLYKMLSAENFKILVIATNQSVAINLVQKVKVMFANLPSWLKETTELVKNNEMSISFANGSSIKAVSASKTAGRSEALSLLIIDEAAFVDNIDHIWTGAQMTLSTGGSAIVLSTPNGVGNLFHKLWEQAESQEAPEGLEVFNPINLKWDLHPDRDQTWRNQQTVLLGEKQAAQECDCDFISSGHTVVEGDILKYYKTNMVEPPKEMRGIDNNYWMWNYPDYSISYVIVADVSRGDGTDYSTFHVFDVEKLEQVAEYKGKVPTDVFGKMLVAAATEWNNALLVIENLNIGWSTVQTVLDSGYDNLYYSYRLDPFLDSNIHLAKMYDLKSKEDMIPGFSTNSRTRPIMISKIEIHMRDRAVIIKSSRTIGELFVFKWRNGKAQASPGYNDDLVMALGIFLFIKDTALRLRQIGIDVHRKTLRKTFKGVHKPNSIKNDPYSRKVGKETVSFRWLL